MSVKMASSRTRPGTWALSALLSVSLFAGGLHAQPTDEAKKTARNLMAEGRTLRDEAKDLKGALDSFRKAHSIMKVPTTGLEVANTLVLMHLYVEAQEAAQEVADIPVAPHEPEPFKTARTEALKLVTETGAKIGYIKIEVKGAPDPKAIDVAIDGLSVGPDALKGPIKQNPGKHTVVIKGPSTRTFEVELTEGGAKDIAVDFKPPAEKKPAVVAPPKQEEPEQPPPSRLMRPLPLVGFGLAGVGVLAGSITGLLALSKGSSAKDQCVDNRCPPAAQSDIDSGKTMGTISTISFALAGAGAIVGIVGYMQDPAAPEKKEKAGVSPWLGLGQAGIAGRF
jgi:hypothetical protein